MFDLLLPVALGIAALFAGWLRCHDASRRGLRRITSVGWVLLLTIVALTVWTALAAAKNERRANLQRQKHGVEIANARERIQELQKAHLAASRAIAQIGTLQRGRAGVEALMATAEILAASMESGATSLGLILETKNPVTRAAQVTGWMRDHTLTRAMTDTLLANWDRLTEILNRETCGGMVAAGHRAMLIRQIDFLHSFSDAIDDQTKMEILHGILLKASAVAREAIRLTRLEYDISLSGRATGLSEDQLGAILTKIRSRLRVVADSSKPDFNEE